MKRSAGSPKRRQSALRSVLAKDPIARLAIGLFTLLAWLYLTPVLDSGQRIFLTHRLLYPIFLSLALAALSYQLGTLVAAEERRFWKDLQIAFGAWFLGSLADLFVSRDVDLFHRISLDDAVYGVYYIAFLMAVERQPHIRDRWRPTDLERRLNQPAIYAFVFALFTYFVVLPSRFPEVSTANVRYSTYLYFALDLYLVARLLFLFRTVGTRRWKMIYSLLTLTAAGVLASDLVDGLFAVRGDSPLNVLWVVPFATTILAARLRHQTTLFDSGPAIGTPGDNLPAERTIVYALLLPLIHFGVYFAGLFDAASKPYRESLVFVWLVLLGALALFQHRLFEINTRGLRFDRAETEKAILTGERDMHFQLGRQAALEKVRFHEEQFFKVFGREVIVVHRKADGRFVEAFAPGKVLGYSRGEIVGRTARELRLLARGEWGRLVRRFRDGDEGPFEILLRDRDGAVHRRSLSTSPIDLDGRSYRLSILRPVPSCDPPAHAAPERSSAAAPVS